MKKFYLGLLISSITFFAVAKASAQCSLTTSGTHCDGQKAIFPTPFLQSGETLDWFQDSEGSIKDGTSKNGDLRYTSFANVLQGTLTQDFFIRKNSSQIIGLASGSIPTGNFYQSIRFGSNVSNRAYEMQLIPEVDFTLDSVTVWARAYQSNMEYGLRVRVVIASEATDNTKGIYSAWHKVFGSGSSIVKVRIPVNIPVVKGGPYLVQIVSYTDRSVGVSSVDEMYYSSTFIDQSYLSAAYKIQLASVAKYADNSESNPLYPYLNDWHITVQCPLVKVASTLTTNANQCMVTDLDN